MTEQEQKQKNLENNLGIMAYMLNELARMHRGGDELRIAASLPLCFQYHGLAYLSYSFPVFFLAICVYITQHAQLHKDRH